MANTDSIKVLSESDVENVATIVVSLAAAFKDDDADRARVILDLLKATTLNAPAAQTVPILQGLAITAAKQAVDLLESK